MVSSWVPILFFTLALAYCAVSPGQTQKVGGLRDEKEADETVKKIILSVYNGIEEKAGRKYLSIEPISYREQFVAGMNFFIKARVTSEDGDPSHIHVRIYRPFRGDLQVTSVLTDRRPEERIEYF